MFNYSTIFSKYNLYHMIACFIFSFVLVFNETLIASELTDNRKAEKYNPVRIITFGHSYPILDTDKKRNEFIKHINDQNVDYVIILGDSDLESTSVSKAYLDNLNAVFLAVPGNHDVQEIDLKNRYLNNIGYLDKTVVEDTFNLILINSSESYKIINKNLANSFNKIKNNNPTLLFAHHRIWDDNYLKKTPYNSFKSYKFEQLDIGLENKVDYIIAGNNPAHYFGNSARIKNNVVNHNIVAWVDIVNGIICYNIGMAGSGGVKVPEMDIATYLLIEITDNAVNVIPAEYRLKNMDNKEINLKNLRNISIQDVHDIKVTDLDIFINYVMTRIKSKTFFAGFAIGIIFIFIITVIIRKVKSINII
jgi:predicted phosphodiesterase